MHGLRKTLKRMVRNPRATLQQLEVGTNFIVSVNRFVDKGSSNGGIFEVETPQGIKALKICSDIQFPEKYGFVGLLVQILLGKLGYTPAIHGILPWASIQELMGKEAVLRKFAWPDWGDFGVIMDLIDGGVKLQTSTITPEIVSNINRDSFLERVKEIENCLDQLWVRAYDFQYLVSPDGQFWLIDLDRYAFISRTGRHHGHAADLANASVRRILNPFLPIRNNLAETVESDLNKVATHFSVVSNCN